MDIRPIKATIYNVAVTDADTEYSQQLAAGTVRFQIRMQDGSAFRLAFETGKVASPTAPYASAPLNTLWEEDGLNPRGTYTLYFASAAGSKTAEIVCWQEA